MPLPGTAQDDPQPGNDLFEAEGFGDVVVAAEVEPAIFLQAVTGGQGQRGRVDAVGACRRSTPKSSMPGIITSRSTESDALRRADQERPDLLEAVWILKPGNFRLTDRFDDVVLVVDDEDTCLGLGLRARGQVRPC